MNMFKIFLSLIPGVSRIHHGRAPSGVLIFFFFVLFLNGYLIASFLAATPTLRYGLLATAALIWILALYDGVRVAATASSPAKKSTPDHERVYDRR